MKFYSIIIDPNVDIEALDIPVNAVATALKDFFSKILPPVFEKDVMKELEEIAGMFVMSFSSSKKNQFRVECADQVST